MLYLSVQKQLGFNWKEGEDHDTNLSQSKAKEVSGKILKQLFEEFPITEKWYDKFVTHYKSKEQKELDLTFLYGKWMKDSKEGENDDQVQNFSEKAKSKQEEIETIIKANAVEEIVSVQVDEKQLEDAVLQHQFEKVETADEFGGNWRTWIYCIWQYP